MKQQSEKESAGKYSLVEALFATTQQKLFALLFGQPDRSFYLTELVRLAKVGTGGVQRELLRLESTGLVTAKNLGNQKHYQSRFTTFFRAYRYCKKDGWFETPANRCVGAYKE